MSRPPLSTLLQITTHRAVSQLGFADPKAQAERMNKAIVRGDMPSVQAYLNSGVPASVPVVPGMYSSRTPLGLAVLAQNPVLVDLLLEHGADPTQSHEHRLIPTPRPSIALLAVLAPVLNVHPIQTLEWPLPMSKWPGMASFTSQASAIAWSVLNPIARGQPHVLADHMHQQYIMPHGAIADVVSWYQDELCARARDQLSAALPGQAPPARRMKM